MSKPTIGFMGLGLMGGAMVGRLQDQGYDLTVIANRTRTYVDQAVTRGAAEVATSKALAEASDIVMLCMDTSANVEARMRGEEGVIAGLKPGAIVIDFGTSLPGSTRALGEEVAAAGGHYLDAPLGRTPGATCRRPPAPGKARMAAAAFGDATTPSAPASKERAARSGTMSPM